VRGAQQSYLRVDPVAARPFDNGFLSSLGYIPIRNFDAFVKRIAFPSIFKGAFTGDLIFDIHLASCFQSFGI
jgi:hypothetical protein